MSPCSTRSHFISSPMASGKLRGGFNNRPGSFFHALASVLQDLSHEHIQPDRHHRFPPFASSKSRKEEPRCRSNQPSLGNPTKVQMR